MSTQATVPRLQLAGPQANVLQVHASGDAAPAKSVVVMSTSRVKYALTPREGGDDQGASTSKTTLTPRDLRDISKFIESNKRLSRVHRSGSLSALIPQGPFERVRDNVDLVLQIAIAPIHAKESALDVPLRLQAPESFHCPAMVDPRADCTVARRIVSLLKGASSVPVHWTGEKEGTERDVAKLNALRDAEVRAKAAHRAQQPIKEALAYCALGALHYNATNIEKTVEAFSLAVHLFEQQGDAQGVAYCHNVLGVCYYRLGEFKMSLIHHKKQEVLAGSYGQAVAQLNMGVCYSALNELKFSEQAFTDALSSALHSRDSILETIAMGNLGLTYMKCGDMRRAQTNFERCLEHCSIASDKVGAAVCLVLLGEVYSVIGDNEHALFYYEHAFRVAEEAKCYDIAEIARVSVGVAKGNQSVKNSLTAMAKQMGQQLTITDILNTLPTK
jgi:tetratricopeptide (TPR) repeat protein